MAKPVAVMVAGPNGAGRSSIAPGLIARTLGILEFVNADLIARGLAGFNPNSAAATAGRIMLRRLDELAEAQLSFAFETTGASRSFARRIASWKRTGYRFLLTFVWVENSSISIERVARRVQLGGHDVPAETIRRRYHRRLVNLFDLCCPIADHGSSWTILESETLYLLQRAVQAERKSFTKRTHGKGSFERQPWRERNVE
jgi:predicted ABC-type ATPase